MTGAITTGIHRKGSPSPNNTVVTAPNVAIIDSHLNAWALTTGRQITVNGSLISYTLGVVKIAYVNGVIWQMNGANDWYSLSLINGMPMTIGGPIKTSPLPVPPSPLPSPSPSGTLVQLGVYCGSVDTVAKAPSPNYPGFDAQWDGFAAAVGRTPTLNLCYLDQSIPPDDANFGWPGQCRYVSGIMMKNTRTVHAVPLLGWPFGYYKAGARIQVFNQIAAGTYDQLIKDGLAVWKAAGYTTLYLRPGWEFNLPYNFAVKASNLTAFLAAFRHFYTVVHSYAAANGMTVSVVWNPNIGLNQNDSTLTVAQQYPGNAYVDVIAIDSYGSPVISNNDSTKTSTDPRQFLVSTMIAMGKANNKPIAGGEIGGADAVFASKFVTAMLDAINQGVKIEFIALWDIDDSSGTMSWTNPVDNQAATAAVWAAALGANGTLRTP